MADQDETVKIVVEVVDKFSKPLRDLKNELDGLSRGGGKGAQQVTVGFQVLRKSVEDTAGAIKSTLAPALSAIGISVLGFSAGLASLVSGMKEFAQSTKQMMFLARETGITVEKLREFEAVGRAAGVSSGQFNSSMNRFARGMQELRAGTGPLATLMQQGDAGVRRFALSLRGVSDNTVAFEKILGFLQQIPRAVDRQRFLEAFGLPAEFARMTRQEIEQVLADHRKFAGELTAQGEASVKGFNAALRTLGDAWEGVYTRLANTGGLDTLTTVLNTWRDTITKPEFIKGIGDFATGLASIVSDMVKLAPAASAAIAEIEKWIGMNQKAKEGWTRYQIIPPLIPGIPGSGLSIDLQSGESRAGGLMGTPGPMGPAPPPQNWNPRWPGGGGTKRGPLMGGILPWLMGGGGGGATFNERFGTWRTEDQEKVVYRGTLQALREVMSEGDINMPGRTGGPGIGGGEGASIMGALRGRRLSRTLGGGGGEGIPPEPTGDLTGNEYLKAQRSGFAKEFETNPNTKVAVAAMISQENPGAGVAVVESLFNRVAFVNAERAKKGLPPISVSQMLHSGFYGPINRGMLPGRMRQLLNNPAALERYMKMIDTGLAGSNQIRGYTDQGSYGDPNYFAGGTGININRERFNDWGAYGHERARQFRLDQQSHVNAARQSVDNATSPTTKIEGRARLSVDLSGLVPKTGFATSGDLFEFDPNRDLNLNGGNASPPVGY
jgi:hypothetical protein